MFGEGIEPSYTVFQTVADPSPLTELVEEGMGFEPMETFAPLVFKTNPLSQTPATLLGTTLDKVRYRTIFQSSLMAF